MCVSVKVTNDIETIRWGYRRLGIDTWLSADPDYWRVHLPLLLAWGARQLILPAPMCFIVSLYQLLPLKPTLSLDV